jgi:hypothetical protein
MRATFARPGAFTLICFSIARGATLANSATAGPEAFAAITQAKYCFARQRGLDPGHLPPAYLVLRLRIRVSYRNSGIRPLILPLERDRTIYTALQPGTMSIFHESVSLFDPVNRPLKDLPADVSPDRRNDLFAVIPARGEMTPPLLEDVTLPVNRKAGFRTYPDLRGHTVYLRLKFEHQQLAPALEAALSDRWARFGIPWTGTLMTDTVAIDVPRNAPHALPCSDTD